jgi:hypothetical protein
MDAGGVAEFDSPLTLFDQKGSIFRSLCDEAGLSRADIMRIRSGEDPIKCYDQVLDNEGNVLQS